MLTKIRFEKFTAFKKLELVLSPGINVLIGTNGTGKTHALKVAYSACAIAGNMGHIGEKLVRCFLPLDDSVGRLVYRERLGRSAGSVEVYQKEGRIRVYISTVMGDARKARITSDEIWHRKAIKCAYIPVKEMLANAPGFSSLYKERAIHFEEVYADIVDRAYRPAMRGPRAKERRELLKILEKKLGGSVETWGQTFAWKSSRGPSLEFTLLAEGMRKLGLLWLLIQNETLWSGSVLFWDEPEANLNPALMRTVAEILNFLQRYGVQILLATHSLAFLKELQLQQKKDDKLRYHALYRNEKDIICVESSDDYFDLSSNAIAEAMDDLFDRTMADSLSGSK
jgi:ABC-type transport system involved in cytochrome c biogenesis ATPase subunit